ncbi:acyloxyacyl hydrolase-like [Apostichopus japonicus]|uniref:acyloxyacyl hydrolase-like n=1 Tax=Stichopus japonicus TaxID=307972 RepID=UPI003AB6AD10
MRGPSGSNFGVYSFVLYILVIWMQIPVQVNCSVNGGSNCAACTLIVSLAEQLSEIHNDTVIEGLDRLCKFLPDPYQQPCKDFMMTTAPIIQQMIFDDVFTPDACCHALGYCYADPGRQECHLYPKPKMGIRSVITRSFPDPMALKIRRQKVQNLNIDICDLLPGIKSLCNMIEKKLDTHMPIADQDEDRFSTIQTLRGTHFRGRDCDDVQKSIYPGRKPVDGDKTEDSNCNGITGVDKKTGNSYEELFCSNATNYGVGILGDSAAAHFHLPRAWFSAVEISLQSLEAVPMIVADEIDWPHLSAVTGYKNSSLLAPWWTDSVYLRLRDVNHCNHRDYQNIGVNGADSGSMNDSIQYTLARNPKKDQPLLLFYSLIGNDVCNGHADTIKDMTLPEDMRKRFRSTLQYLDTQLPKGSHVFATGLADGRVLFDTLKDKIHPIGDWRQDITYPDIYNYLNCLESSPCSGWMTTNETLRNFTSERAANLSKVVQEEAKLFKPTNFDVHYMDYNIQRLIQMWTSTGGKAADIIEPVDGFHPSQVANFLLAEYYWEEMNKLVPGLFRKNPHNAEIKKLFGDQGGY